MKNWIKNSLESINSKVAKVVVGVGATVVGASAHAALPTEATAAFTTLSGNVTDIFAAVWPLVATVTGGFVLISLFKKGASKAA